MIAVLMALFITGCGTDSKNQLKQPSVYKNPQVRVTHAPTTVAVDSSPTDITSSATEVANDLQVPEATATDEDDQVYLDDVDNLLNKVEDELDRMNTNP